MSDIIAAGESAQSLAGEIRYIVRQTQTLVLTAAIEIGRRLCRAKELVPSGEWGQYLKEEVDFSTSSANNYMKLYREYGTGQESLFGGTDPQTLGDLPYTKALALLAVPAEEREAFLTECDVERISTRELKDAIRSREAAEKRAQTAEQEAQGLRTSWEAAERDLDKANEEKKEAEGRAAALERDAETLKIRVEGLEKQLVAAKKDADRARKEADEAQKKTAPGQVSDEEMARIRAEAAAEAEKKAQAQVDKARREAEAAERAASEARQAVERMTQRIEKMERAAAAGEQDGRVREFQMRLGRCQEDMDWMIDTLDAFAGESRAEADGMKKALCALVDNMAEALGHEPAVGGMDDD